MPRPSLTKANHSPISSHSCVRGGVAWRRTQDAFLARASDAVERSEREDSGISPQEVLRQMDVRLEAARQRLAAGKASAGQ